MTRFLNLYKKARKPLGYLALLVPFVCLYLSFESTSKVPDELKTTFGYHFGLLIVFVWICISGSVKGMMGKNRPSVKWLSLISIILFAFTLIVSSLVFGVESPPAPGEELYDLSIDIWIYGWLRTRSIVLS